MKASNFIAHFAYQFFDRAISILVTLYFIRILSDQSFARFSTLLLYIGIFTICVDFGTGVQIPHLQKLGNIKTIVMVRLLNLILTIPFIFIVSESFWEIIFLIICISENLIRTPYLYRNNTIEYLISYIIKFVMLILFFGLYTTDIKDVGLLNGGMIAISVSAIFSIFYLYAKVFCFSFGGLSFKSTQMVSIYQNGIKTISTPAFRAPCNLEYKPPISQALPSKSTSPVIATLFLIGILRILDTIAVVMANPADGPSLGVALSGQ